MKKSILVTGGAGYIGSHACKALAEAGYRPVVYDNLSYGHRWAVQWGPLVEGDLADADWLQQTLRVYEIDAVMHFAAFTYVGESVTDPSKYFSNNVANSLTLLNVLRQEKVQKLVFSSTCATYGLPRSVPMSEDHPQAPINSYGDSKLMVERMMRRYGEAYGLRWAALRYFNAAGADPEARIGEDHRPETHLIPLVIEAALGRRPHIEIMGTDYPTHDGTAVRDYIHVDDLAQAHVRALQHLEKGGESVALNLGTGRGYSVREIISAVERITGRKVPVRTAPRRAGDPPSLVAQPARAQQVLCWQATRTLEQIILHAWNWHRRQAEANNSEAA
jgi:UDP-glucose-4-epimerase GalE